MAESDSSFTSVSNVCNILQICDKQAYKFPEFCHKHKQGNKFNIKTREKMFRRRNVNYHSDAYKDYREYFRRSNPTIPLPDHGSQYLHPSINKKQAPRAEVDSKHHNRANESKKHSPEKRNKKVEFAEAESTIEIEHNAGSSEHVYEVKSIDMEANDFIKRKHKLFEMAKLASLKAYY